VQIPQPEHQQLNAVNNVEQEPQQPNDPTQPDQDDQSKDTQHDTLSPVDIDFHSAAKKRKIVKNQATEDNGLPKPVDARILTDSV
jgi:hypothetical protein